MPNIGIADGVWLELDLANLVVTKLRFDCELNIRIDIPRNRMNDE